MGSSYRKSAQLTIDQLEEHEKRAFGGLLRVLVRLDGAFTPDEAERLDVVATAVGGRDALQGVIELSAQEHADDDAVKADAQRVERLDVQQMIRESLEVVARASTIDPAEQALLDWVDTQWKMGDHTP